MEGEQGERSIEIRAWRYKGIGFIFFLCVCVCVCRALKDAVSLSVEIVCVKKHHFHLKHQFRGHSASRVLVVSSGDCIINRHICKRGTTDALKGQLYLIYFLCIHGLYGNLKCQLLTGPG